MVLNSSIIYKSRKIGLKIRLKPIAVQKQQLEMASLKYVNGIKMN